MVRSRRGKAPRPSPTSATLGFEVQLWAAANALRLPVRAGNARTQTGGSMDAAEHKDVVVGRVCEYFLGQFASAEGKKGGEFYTPRSIVKLLVEMLRPCKGRVYDPCCLPVRARTQTGGSPGMFVQSEEFLRLSACDLLARRAQASAQAGAHGGRIGDISIYGQELNYTTWRLAKMNLAIRGIDGRIAQPVVCRVALRHGMKRIAPGECNHAYP